MKRGKKMSNQNFDAACNGNCSSCGSDCEPGQATVTLTLDNDEVLECAILTIFPVGGKSYIALLPLNENGENEDGEVFLYRYKDENGNPSLENIEDDDEYDLAAEGFDNWLDTQEFDAMDLDDIVE